MKTIVKLALFLLIAHALFRYVPPYWHHRQFEAAVKARAFDWRESTDAVVLQEILAFAEQHQVPIGREHVSLKREKDHLYIEVAYTLPIEFIPAMTREVPFEVTIDAWVLRPPTVPR